MNVVTVSKKELLERLRINRDNHAKLYKEALAGYRAMVIDEMRKNLDAAQDGGEIKTAIQLQAPQDHTEDYDDIIQMVEMSVHDQLELQSGDFQCYVLDKWHWAKHVSLLNSTYASAVR